MTNIRLRTETRRNRRAIGHMPGYDMRTAHKPVANKAFGVTDKGETLVLQLAGAPKTVELNTTAAQIWRLCDGKRTVAQIADLMANPFPGQEERVSRDVVVCLRSLETVGAVRPSGDDTPASSPAWPIPLSTATAVDGLGYVYGFKGDLISSVIEKNRIWERYLHPVFERYVSAGDTVLDAGCYIGTHTIKLARLCAPGSVLAFEPHPDICRVVRANLEKNGIANVQLFEKGLSDRPGEARYAWFSAGNLSASGLENNPKGVPEGPNAVRAGDRKLSVSLTTVDDLQLARLDLMKIDVEGYEIKVLRGAAATLERCRPVVVLESWKSNLNEDRGVVEDLDNLASDSPLRFLMDRGYAIQPIDGPDFLALPARRHRVSNDSNRRLAARSGGEGEHAAVSPAFLFFHIPKCAGTSVKASLRIVESVLSVNEDRSLSWRHGIDKRFGWDSSLDLDKIYSFTIVRNPWDRAVSAWKSKNPFQSRTLAEYLQHPFLPAEQMRSLSNREFARQATYEWHNMPQVDYISREERFIVKEIFRFENLSDDWPIIQKTTGTNAWLLHVNRSKREDYRYYYDEETYALVAERYARDIDEFGYEF